MSDPEGSASFVHLTAAPEFVRRIMIHDLVRLRAFGRHAVWCADGPGLGPVRDAGFDTTVLTIERKMSPLTDLRTIASMVRRLRRASPTVLHTYTPKAGLVGQIAGAISGVRHRVHSVRGLLYTPEMSPWKRRLFRLTDRLTFRLAHRVIFISGSDRDHCVSTGLCRPDKAEFTGSGIDLSIFDPAAAPRDRASLRAAWGVAADAQVVLTVGRYVHDKGYPELAEAVERIRSRCPSARFVWVAPVFAGEADTLPDDFLAARHIDDVVIRLGLQDDMTSIYAAADLLVHPSHREGVPRALMEAGAMGLPIVATDIPGNREVVHDETVGWLVPVRSPDGLAAAVTEALTDDRMRATRAAALTDRVRTLFSQEAVSRNVGVVYARMLGGTA